MNVALVAQFVGAGVGMVLFVAVVSWVIRRIVRKIDFSISVAIAMLLLTILAGFGYADGGPWNVAAAALYVVAGIPAFFVIVAAARRSGKAS